MSAAKTRILQSIGGLVILFLSSLILYTINPTFFKATILGVQDAMAQMPEIPKPDLLPGPEVDSSASETKNFFLFRALPGFSAGFLSVIGGLAMVMIVWAGIRFVIAFGEEEAITNARKTAIWAVIGFGVALLSYALVSIINTLNFPDEANTNQPLQEDVIYNDI